MNEPVICRRCGYENLTTSIAGDLVDDIVAIAGRLFAVDPQAIQSRSQRQRVVAARQAVCAVMRNALHMPYADIGAALDRDHTTIIHSVRRCDPGMYERLLDALEPLLPDEEADR